MVPVHLGFGNLQQSKAGNERAVETFGLAIRLRMVGHCAEFSTLMNGKIDLKSLLSNWAPLSDKR